jgi:catechol 2,3-dioxygenase-like lactoylglutathione lyase family enzyme
MNKIRHIAIASRDPGKTAEFYKKTFGWREVSRGGQDRANPNGVILSDGSINITILNFQTDQIGKGLGYEGFHHIGVVVDDVNAWAEKLEAQGVPMIVGEDEIPPGAQYEIKYQGPDTIVFDITDVPWPGSVGLDGVPAPDKVPSAREQNRPRLKPKKEPA